MHSDGSMCSNSAPRRYGSGSGLPRATISPEITSSGTGSPAASSRATISRFVAEVTIAQRSFGSFSSNALAPGKTFRSAVSSTSISSMTRKPSAICSSVKSGFSIRRTSTARTPCGTLKFSASTTLCCLHHCFQQRSTEPMELTRTPSISNSSPFVAIIRVSFFIESPREPPRSCRLHSDRNQLDKFDQADSSIFRSTLQKPPAEAGR